MTEDFVYLLSRSFVGIGISFVMSVVESQLSNPRTTRTAKCRLNLSTRVHSRPLTPPKVLRFPHTPLEPPALNWQRANEALPPAPLSPQMNLRLLQRAIWFKKGMV